MKLQLGILLYLPDCPAHLDDEVFHEEEGGCRAVLEAGLLRDDKGDGVAAYQVLQVTRQRALQRAKLHTPTNLLSPCEGLSCSRSNKLSPVFAC